MPPLKVKTNLPNAGKSAAKPYDAAMKNTQTKAGKGVKVTKVAKTVAKSGTVTKNKVQVSRKKVEVEILVGEVDDEIDELMKHAKKQVSKHHEGDQPPLPASSTVQQGWQQHPSRLAFNPPRSVTPGDAGYWSGNEYAAPADDDHESIDVLIDDLLKPKTGKRNTTSKQCIDKALLLVELEVEDTTHTLNKASSSTSALGRIGDGKVKDDDTMSAAQQSSNAAAVHGRLPKDPISPDDFDLAHTIVIRVLEHALKKNVDWFTMAKELEDGGLTNVKPIKAAKGKGRAKSKNAGEIGLEGEEAVSKTAKMPKVDGTFLFFHRSVT
ncbi:hypothetical protein QFC22_002814 [Naganishia vaughanmartiniae]|uniref:Uncharacterized protein n=1 Tax=Naganishia vaughanmartiniae TaxID=1424756 RepID=A0ACC2XA35_9TREE|nr:hypothetical protein QFC22_002814 [Naganishia vaughanmartiniae]